MPSIIEGCNYDIFISYRQKDNRHDGWVTEFVNQLKGELEATFKEDISIYFDENPHDGLLETHSVDKSLEGKLNCLIFIPIISQTYCDLKSYAWKHEFCAFNKLAKEDKFGRDTRLSSGNVASRILPVKIHDLDPEDKALIENELGGVLRSIELIYKSAGVNRPLRANEDHPQDNLNKTYYRDQINKVANACKEIITALKKQNQYPEEFTKQDFKVTHSPKKNLRTKIIAGSLIVLSLIVLGYFFIPKLFKPSQELEKSIAVLPFINDSPSDSTTYFVNGLMDEILNSLQQIGAFSKVLSRTSTEQYRNIARPSIPKIAKDLDVSFIVEGSGQKYGNSYQIRVQLIEGKTDKHLWVNSYEREIKGTKDVYDIQSQIAQAIAAELKAVINPVEKQLIEKTPTSDLNALYHYQKGKEELSKYISSNTNKLNKQAVINNRMILISANRQFKKALEYDSTFALAYSGLARTFQKANYKQDSGLLLCNKAIFYDKQLSEAYLTRGIYYYNQDRDRDWNEVSDEFDKVIKFNPNYWEGYYYKGLSLSYNGSLLMAIVNLQKAASLNRGSEYPDILFELSRVYRNTGFFEKSKELALEVLKLDGDSVRYISMVSTVEVYLGNFQKALELRRKAYVIDSTNNMAVQQLGEIYEAMSMWEEALKYWKKYSAITGTLVNFDGGYAYLKNGYKKEAEDIFNRHMEYYKNRKNDNNTYLRFATIFLIRGEKEKAYEYLKRCSQAKEISVTDIIRLNFPWFDSIRDESEFQEIVSEMKAKFQAGNERVRKWLEENNIL